MIKKSLFIFVISFLFFLTLAFGDLQEITTFADKLNEEENYEDENIFLLDSLEKVKDSVEKAELYWRLARVTLNLGDESEKRGLVEDKLLEIFDKGAGYASKAIELDPDNHLGYFWKSANIGRWGQIKGVLNALRQADDMRDLLKTAVTLRPDHAISFSVLGQLYEQVPGFPISFGNVDYSVSLGRKAIVLHEGQYRNGSERKLDHDYYTELAKHLYKRNWSVVRRERELKKKKEKYSSAPEILEKSFYYESTIDLKKITDREEAREILDWVISELEKIHVRTKEQEDNLKEALETFKSW
jgi:tetratricopeptide (TPR) repeat protein